MEKENFASNGRPTLKEWNGINELLEAMKANKSQEEIMRILRRHPELMASFIIARDEKFFQERK